MFVMFGWLKERKPAQPLLDCYCYICQRQTTWALSREKEWVTLLTVRVLPIKSAQALGCARCGDEVRLPLGHAQRFMLGGVDAEVAALLEKHQLASKSETQRNFLVSERTVHESRRKGKSNGKSKSR